MGISGWLKNRIGTDDPAQVKREFSWLLGRVKQFRGLMLVVGGLGILGTGMSLASSVASKHLIDAVTGMGTGTIARAAVIMAVMMLGSLGLQAVSSHVSAKIHVVVRNQMQQDIYGKVLRAAWQALEPYRSGDLLNRLNSDINTVADGVIGFLPNLLAAAVKFIGAFAIMVYYDPVMALIALVGAPVTLALSRVVMGRLRSYNLTMKELTGEVMSFQEDSFRNLTSIKAFAVTGQYEDEMVRLQDRYADAYLSFNTFRIGMNSGLSLVSMLVTTACFGWGVYQLWSGQITYGSLTMFMQLASTLRGAFSTLISLAQQAISISTSAGRIMAVEDLPSEEGEVPEGFDQEKKLAIRLRGTEFRYQNGEDLLRSFSFDACSGDLIALVGPSGEGKTTLLRLLLGLVEPCAGTAELIGDSGSHYRITAGTRYAFAYVPQGNSMFSGTVAQNLRIVCPEATDEELEQALKTACAWEFVQQFPEGLEHRLASGGRGVSEGQAQRLAIARALLRRAPILLLDEATSGLDMATERQLLKNLKDCGMVRTCILVTHRPDSAEFCSRTYEVRGGCVTEVTYGA